VGFWRNYGGTHAIVELDSDPLAASALSAAIPMLRELLRGGALPAEPARWELATGTPSGDVRASCGDRTWRLDAGGASAADRGGARQPLDRLPLTDGSPLLHRFGEATLQQHPRAFFQACPAWAWQAFGTVLGGWGLSGGKLFDLYGGGGFFSRRLAGCFAQYSLIENSLLACVDARSNLAGQAAQVHQADVAAGLRGQPSNWAGPDDTVLLDPPRSGLASEVTARLRTCGAQQLVLIGCDGAAFCRDIKAVGSGTRWELAQLAVIDLFPFTPEVECIGLLRRGG
jgi:23S rRNA (uracil1939-C5)-methyltransferase